MTDTKPLQVYSTYTASGGYPPDDPVSHVEASRREMNLWQVPMSGVSAMNDSFVRDCGPNVLTHANDSFSRKLTFIEPPWNDAYWSKCAEASETHSQTFA